MNQHPASPPEPFGRATLLLARFLQVEAASTILLLFAMAAAVVWANSPLARSYVLLWQTPVPLRLGPWLAGQSIQFWIDEGLMTLFFLLVGLEIRSELHNGILSDRRAATLPVVAALGGILVPALVFMVLNPDPVLRRGWAIPTATDIAFAVGALTLLGRRAPATLRVLLLTLAVVDDIGAILVIALYYSHGVAVLGLAVSAGAILLVLVFRHRGLRRAVWYFFPGALLWYGLGSAGIHPTLAGVILGLLTPVQNKRVAGDCPAARLKDALHPWVAFGIMPLFAFANAGVTLVGVTVAASSTFTVALGVMLGLVIGKPLGIVLTTSLCVGAGVCALPRGIRWPHVVVLGCLGGVGFTMSIFLAGLAFSRSELLETAKGSVLLASVAAACLGLVLGRVLLEAPRRASP